MNNNTLSKTKTGNLIKKIIIRLVLVFILLGILLFIPAGSFRYWQAWLFCIVLFIPITCIVIYFLKKDPELIERRIKFKESVKEQKRLIKIGYVIYLSIFILPGFDYSFQWSEVPVYLVILGDIIFLTGYFIFFLVMKENSYASRIIEVDKNQGVISTGPYAIVRHPMYSAILIMYIALPVALGSFWALIVSSAFPVMLIMRILNEEKILSDNLNGYKEYCLKTRYRLIPFIW